MPEWTTRAWMSFGAGRQSTALALLAINRDERLLAVTGGVLPELYIFADTGDEPKALYPHVEKMAAMIREAGGRFARVSTPLGKLSEHVKHAALNGHRRMEQLPFWVTSKGRMFVETPFMPIKRHCTEHFKIKPATVYARSYFGVYKGRVHDGSQVQLWLGISSDEKQREKVGLVPDQAWQSYACPLLALGWTVDDCVAYTRTQRYLDGEPVAIMRSACVFCPFHDIDEWRNIAAVPEDWAVALEVDRALEIAHERGGFATFRNPLFLNKYGKQLRDLDLRIAEINAHGMREECAGVCGV